MLSSPLPSKIRPKQNQFLGDITQVFRRHKISFGNRSDPGHLTADLQSNERFRSDLFSLCTAISHMSESDLPPEDLLNLVAEAMSGQSQVDIPEDAKTSFAEMYEAWSRRFSALDSVGADPEESEPAWQSPANPFSTAATLSGNQPRPDKLRDQPGAPPRPLTPDTPIGSLTLGEIKNYLEEIEQRVSRLQPFLDAVSKTNAPVGTGPGTREIETHDSVFPVPLDAPRMIEETYRSEPAIESYGAERLVESSSAELPYFLETSHDFYERQPSLGDGFRPRGEPAAGYFGSEASLGSEQRYYSEPEPALASGDGDGDGTGYATWEVYVPRTDHGKPYESSPLGRADTQEPWGSFYDSRALPYPIVDPTAEVAQKYADASALDASRLPAGRIISGAAVVLAIVAGAAIGYREFGTSPVVTSVPTAPVTSAVAVPVAPKQPPARSSSAAGKQLSNQHTGGPGTSARTASAANKPFEPARVFPTDAVSSSSGLASTLKPILSAETASPPAPVAPSMKQPSPSLPEQRQPAVVPAPSAAAARPTEVIEPYNQRTITPSNSGPQSATTNVAANVRLAAPAANAAPITRREPEGNVTISVPSPTMMTYAISTPAPEYPSFRRPVDTSVIVEATVGKDGRVISAKPVSGASDLAASAVKATQRWRFRPYVLNGSPVQVVTNIKFVFKGPN